MNRHHNMPSDQQPVDLTASLDAVDRATGDALRKHHPEVRTREVGRIMQIGQGIARVDGLPNAQSDELLRFPDNRRGIAFNLDPHEIGVILLDHAHGIEAGELVYRTGRVVDVPVGPGIIGRVVDPLGRPLDESGPVQAIEHRPIERDAPGIMERSAVGTPLQTGIKAIDALVPIGRGQRELIVGDRQTGKSSIAIDTIVNQRGKDVLCIYCAVGQQGSAVAKLIDDLRRLGAMEYTSVVATTGDDPAGLQFIAPYAATTMAEYFMERGRDVLIVYDNLTTHAVAYRELSLLLRRPPGREAFPGDIFYIHSRLLERATHLNESLGGGSLTALPIVETEAQNISGYIPTNLISITDGQIFLSPRLFQQGVLPAVDVGRSVSRVGGQAQLPAFRAVAGPLRLSYAQFEELERFARYGARLEENMRRTLDHGRRVRAVLKQPVYAPLPAAHQIAVLLAVTEGLLDTVSPDKVADVEAGIGKMLSEQLPDVVDRIHSGKQLSDDDRAALLKLCSDVIAPFGLEVADGND
ncbi:MAG: alternate F1F0 ATPase, F1 subunit alpha [Phycisphaera sp.]|nr:alternate F1F0 ATPase, F1 subunit alpha [Phycisphaera sp.]